MTGTRGRWVAAFLALTASAALADERKTEALPWPAVARLGGDAWKPGVSIDELEWSADDSRVTVLGGDESVPVDVSTGRILERTPREHPRYPRREEGHVIEALSPDGTRRASVGRNAPVRIRDLATDAVKDSGRLPTSHNVTWDPSHIAWSPDGKLLAVGGADGVLSVLDGRSAALLYQREAHESGMGGMAWSPDGTRIATGGSGKFVWATENSGGNDGIVRIYAAADGKELFTLGNHKNDVDGVSWSPDGSRLVSWSRSEGRLWNPADGSLVVALESDEGYGSVQTATWSPDGGRFATCGLHGPVRIFEGATGRVLRKLESPGGAMAIAWSHRGDRIASGGFQGALWIHDAVSGRVHSPHGGHTGEVRGVAWSPDGRVLATAGEDGSVILWDGSGFGLLHTLQSATFGEFTGVAWAPDGNLLAASRGDGGVSLFDPVKGTETSLLVPPPLEEGERVGGAGSPAWSPDGRLLAVGGEAPQVRIWSVREGRLLRVLGSTAGAVDGLGWSADGAVLRGHGRGEIGVASRGGDLLAWEVATGTPRAPPAGPTRRLPVLCAAWSTDGTFGASQEEDGTVRVWDAASWRCLHYLNGPLGGGFSAAFSPDGTWIATGCEKGRIVLYDASTLTRLFSVKAHAESVGSVAWSPSGDRLATLSGTGPPLVWDLLPAPRKEMASAALPPDGPMRGVALGDLWNRLGDPRLEAGMLAEEEFAALGAPGIAFARERLRAVPGAPPPEADPRALRALRAVARSRTAEARELLEALAAGPEDSPLRPAASSLLRATAARPR